MGYHPFLSLYIAYYKPTNRITINKMDRCINVDWFQIYCLQPYGCNLPQIISQKYTIRDRGMGTRHFKMLMDVWRDEKYLEIQYLPFSVKSDKGKRVFGTLMPAL